MLPPCTKNIDLFPAHDILKEKTTNLSDATFTKLREQREKVTHTLGSLKRGNCGVERDSATLNYLEHFYCMPVLRLSAHVPNPLFCEVNHRGILEQKIHIIIVLTNFSEQLYTYNSGGRV